MAGEAPAHRPALDRLAEYYGYLAHLAAGYVKDPEERAKQVAIVDGWRGDVDRLRTALDDGPRSDGPAPDIAQR